MGLRAIVGIGLMASGAGILFWQGYEYLRFNTWTSLSIITFLGSIGIPELARWANFPTDWIGLYQILSRAPLSPALLVAGFFLWLAS